MERKSLSFFLMFVVIIGMLVEQSDGISIPREFEKCMKPCLIDCTIPPWLVACPFRCLAKCIIHPFAKSTDRTHQFCTFGCATSKCSKLISKNNYRLDEVEDCVDECSQTCVNNYGPAN
ncbi:conserved hypothetical protein [Ricinus communis]|uniref:Uncharacterized protein n=1 Tax=Ricinus communis TaxID=3988 RepID=B9SQB3_RICCO|nr:conserved hypothetical protein [Ricinus communis]